MFIPMQGNWTVQVKSKNAAFPQRFVIQNAVLGNGTHLGNVGTSVFVVGTHWTIVTQHDPGTGFQSSEMKIKFPTQSGGNYKFDIESNDSGNDQDFDDLILTCSTPASINEFLVYGNVTLYSGRCVFNPCRRFPFVIETAESLVAALKNPNLRKVIERLYPERIPDLVIGPPNPPDPPPYFKPIVLDLSGEAMQSKTQLAYRRKKDEPVRKEVKEDKQEVDEFATSNFELISSGREKAISVNAISNDFKLAKIIEGLKLNCITEAGSGLTLNFEEYDRTAAELTGGPYTGTGNRRALGGTATDMFGNYIFRFRFDMTVPGLEDSGDIALGENVDTIIYPDVIVKIMGYSPIEIRYESAPYYNVPNFKRINLCLPESKIRVTSACFNGNLIGSLGNVFIGGTQNTAGSTSVAATTRHGASNYLESTGIISVNNSLASFSVECAAWGGIIDMFGCMYDHAKTAANNKIRWYTIQIRRSGTGWTYVSENYKHPLHHKAIDAITYPGYIGDDVGPFYPPALGGGTIPAYKNIQREVVVDGVDWRNDKLDRLMILNTTLYDKVLGETTPGKFYVRVDGYDVAGNLVAGATDLIALYIHNLGLKFGLKDLKLDDPAIVNAGCGLLRLTNAQLKTPMLFQFQASDPYGFVDNYALTMGRCPGTPLNLESNIEAGFTINGSHTFPGGSNAANHHLHSPVCPGYKGTQDDYSDAGMIEVSMQPTAVGDGWIKNGEYFTIYSFGLTASQRVTNGYNSAMSGTYQAYGQIMMELLP